MAMQQGLLNLHPEPSNLGTMGGGRIGHEHYSAIDLARSRWSRSGCQSLGKYFRTVGQVFGEV